MLGIWLEKKTSQPVIVMFEESKVEESDRNFIKSIQGTKHRKQASLPSCGTSGGILIIWGERIILDCETIMGELSLSIRFGNHDNNQWCLIVVYGPNSPSRRMEQWEELFGLYGCAFQIGVFEEILMQLDWSRRNLMELQLIEVRGILIRL